MAYAPTTSRDGLDLPNIRVVENWGENKEAERVDSAISYTQDRGGSHKQWGFDIADRSDVSTRMKLDFEEQQNRGVALAQFTRALLALASLDFSDPMTIKSRYHELGSSLKDAESITKDFLSKVVEFASFHVSQQLGSHVLENIPVDLVVTHPTVCWNPHHSSMFPSSS